VVVVVVYFFSLLFLFFSAFTPLLHFPGIACTCLFPHHLVYFLVSISIFFVQYIWVSISGFGGPSSFLCLISFLGSMAHVVS
jgi:hypothetical protein